MLELNISFLQYQDTILQQKILKSLCPLPEIRCFSFPLLVIISCLDLSGIAGWTTLGFQFSIYDNITYVKTWFPQVLQNTGVQQNKSISSGKMWSTW